MKIQGLNNKRKQRMSNGGIQRYRVHAGIALFSAAMTFLFMIAALPMPAWAACPSQDQMKEKLERLTRSKVDVIAVQESAVPGICEVAFRQRSRLRMVYTDADGRHFLFGKIVEAGSAPPPSLLLSWKGKRRRRHLKGWI